MFFRTSNLLTARVPSRRNGRIDLEQPDDLRTRLARIVAVGDAERRGFERELHDGTQQELIALAVNLQLARRLSDTDPEAARQLLAELCGDVHDALDRVRELATKIFPPLLASRGLVDALRAAGRSVRVEGGALPRYPPDVEAGVYFFCLSSAVEPARIRLWHDDESLAFEVTSAAEIPPDASDRIVALGGTVSPSGSSVAGSIPAQPLSAR